jgi:hypothetical protein
MAYGIPFKERRFAAFLAIQRPARLVEQLALVLQVFLQ